MKPQKTTKKVGAQTAEVKRHYYKLHVDSVAGKKLARFWHNCQNCEEAAEDWCKKFGAKFYYSDPNYFAGGVACVSFGDGEVNKNEWRSVGDIDGEEFYLPAVQAVSEMVEIPHREYQLKDSWDIMYLRGQIRETPDHKIVIPKISFRPAGPQFTSKNRPVQCGRKMRRAIIAEQHRLKLPVMTVGQLYEILGAKDDGKAKETPTFFVRGVHFYIGCVYECKADGMEEMTQQQYRTQQCYAEREAGRETN